MVNVVEMPTGSVLLSNVTHDAATTFIQNIESSTEYARLLSVYGSLRRVQQELTVSQS